MRTLTSWCLAGALAASLTWNWTQHRGAAASPSAASTRSGAVCAEPESCSLGGEELGLDPATRSALAELCQSSCIESDRLERRANELQAELLASLSAPTVDPAVTARLVGEVGELRERSLRACVEGILGVRAVLSPAQVKALLARCESSSASCR